VSSTTQVTDADATIQTDDGPMPVHVAIPPGTPKGAVAVIQEAFGVTAHIQDVTRRLARAGWHAVAPALFHREGSPVISYDDIENAKPVMGRLTSGGLTLDLLATFRSLEESGFGARRTAVVGFCMGGSVALYAATLRPLGAAVTFYGGGVTIGRFGLPPLVDLAPSLATPWLGLYGDADQSIPVADVEALREQAAKAPVETEVVRYAAAGHGFHCDERPGHFAPEAAADAWRRTLDWLERHAGPDAPGA
jgi:carboxymethylenebutenolidase